MLRLSSEPVGASVRLCRVEEEGPLLVESPAEVIGCAPLERTLPRGSYVALLSHDAHLDTRYPFVVDRGEVHDATVRLAAVGSMPEGFVPVPGGPTIVGRSERDLPALARQRVGVGDMIVGRFPVTFGEYCAFLDDGVDPEDPRTADYLPSFGKELYVEREGGGGWMPGRRLGRRSPVFALTVAAVDAYCEWLGRRMSRPVRLLSEAEWERCARGADGRIFPWGNGFDWSFCKGGLSRRGEAFPEDVGTFPRDVSVFGVRDLAGTIREICGDTYADGQRAVRGGSWYTPSFFVFRTDVRSRLREGSRVTDIGFRVACGAGGRRGGS